MINNQKECETWFEHFKLSNILIENFIHFLKAISTQRKKKILTEVHKFMFDRVKALLYHMYIASF